MSQTQKSTAVDATVPPAPSNLAPDTGAPPPKEKPPAEHP